MIDLRTLPSRLPSLATPSGPISIERVAAKHSNMLCEAAQASIQHVRSWLGTDLCPLTPVKSRLCVEKLEEKRESGYGIYYMLVMDKKALGMGFINYIHPVHKTGNLGFWVRPDACGRGLASALCHALTRLAFNQMDLHRLELFIEPDNKGSLRVAEKINAIKEGYCRKRIFGRDALLYAVIRKD